MNFQIPTYQTDLTASLISACIRGQSQHLTPVPNTVESLLKSYQLQLLQSQLIQQSLPTQHNLTPLGLIKSGPIVSTPIEMISPLVSNPLLDAYQVSQLNKARMMLPVHSFGSVVHQPTPSLQSSAAMLSNLLEKYTTMKQNETAALIQASSNSGRPDGQPPVYQSQPYDPLDKISKKRPRRKALEIERTHKCPITGCEKSYGSEASMLQHYRLKHPMSEERNQDLISPSMGQKELTTGIIKSNETHPARKPSQAESTDTAISTPVLN